MREKIDGMGPVELLEFVWNAAPSGIDPHTYVQLVVACIRHGTRMSTVEAIESHVPNTALAKLPPLTRVPSVDAVLTVEQHKTRNGINDWISHGTEVILGPVAERLSSFMANELSPRKVANAVQHLLETGDTSRIEFLLSEHGATSTPKPEATHRPTAHRADRSPAASEADAAPRNDPIALPKLELFSSPPFSRLSAYNGRFEPDLACSDGDTECGNLGHELGYESRDRRTLADVPVARQEELLRREPLGWVPDKPVPTSTYADIITWRPILEDSAPLMSIHQLILTSTKRDDNAATERTCAGMPAACELICGAFGYKPQRAWDVGLNAGIFLELYQSRVDSDLTWSGWHGEKGRARVILNHSTPHEIMNSYLEFTMSPRSETDRTFLVSGKKANTRDALRPERKKRERTVNTNEPRVDPPETTLKMKEYLNNIPSNIFTNGRYGIFGGDAFEKLAEKAREIPDEERRRLELRKIYQMRAFPKPLYAGCDRSPRLRADRYNQLMNLKTKLRKSLYDPTKDRELDLSKAHLASYVPTVRQEGIATPELDRCLQGNLEDDTDLLEQGDLWLDIATTLDTTIFTDLQALRDAVKRLYSIVYGMERGRMLHEIASEYDDATGFYPETHEPLEPLLSHPLVAELLETREKLREITNEKGGLHDANGNFIPLSAWNKTKAREDRWRGVMAYVNASYETEIVGAAFEEAIKEKERDARTRFKIWLYQADGFTIRVSSKASVDAQVKRLKQVVADKAEELGVPTKLEVDWPEKD